MTRARSMLSGQGGLVQSACDSNDIPRRAWYGSQASRAPLVSQSTILASRVVDSSADAAILASRVVDSYKSSPNEGRTHGLFELLGGGVAGVGQLREGGDAVVHGQLNGHLLRDCWREVQARGQGHEPTASLLRMGFCDGFRVGLSA
eukprot:1181411-Prorocentrum_minimum.AAC.8